METRLVVRLNAVTVPPDRIQRELIANIPGRMIEIEGETDEEILAHARDADAIMVVSSCLRAPVIRELTRCRVIARIGTGVDKIDVAAATRKGIFVTNLPGAFTEEVADHTMALLLAAARRLKEFEALMRRGGQPRGPQMGSGIHRLSAQVLGMIGFGRIGRAVARRAAGFGPRIMAFDPQVPEEAMRAQGVNPVDLATLLRESDYLCILCPLLPATRGLLGLREFRAMKPGAVLINTGRGEVVVEEDLVSALREGLIGYAALDVFAGINVFASQGFATDHPLLGLKNVILTPHVSALSEESAPECLRHSAEAVVDVLAGRWPQFPVNPEVSPWFPIRKATGRDCV